MPQLSYKAKLEKVKQAKKKLDKIQSDMIADFWLADGWEGEWSAAEADRQTYYKKHKMESTMKIQSPDVMKEYEWKAERVEQLRRKFDKVYKDYQEDVKEFERAKKELEKAAEEAGLLK